MRLAEVLGALAETGSAPANYSSSLFFMNAKGVAQTQLASAKAANPRITFAIDYLFWHAYGVMPEPQRMELLEQGLARLDEIGGTIVIADLPDMRHAVGKMLFAAQVPRRETLTQLNARLTEWAGSRPRVVLVPLTETVAAAMSKGSVTLGGRTYSGAEARGLLSWDGLHASLPGLIALAQEALVRLKGLGVLGANVQWPTESEAIMARIVDRRGQGAAPAGSGGARP